jgi:DNA-binding transcriptional ArsR family regulator
MTAYQNAAPRNLSSRLSAEHRRTLEEGSAIAREVLEESGARTITDGRELPKGFSKRQRRRGSGILFTVPRPNGETSWCFRPDVPDPKSPGRKYEMPCKAYGGPGNILYIHPSQSHLIGNKRVPIIFVEGIKKALAIVSAARAAGVEVLVVGIVGVWNWLSNGKPIADMLAVPLEGREVRICFDDDVFSNPDVADAAQRLAGHVSERGAAAVRLAYLPLSPDGSKTGADDYFARGHSYTDFAARFKTFDPADLAAERLKRGDILRAKLEDLRRTLWATEFKGMGGYSSRDVFKALVDLAPDRGKLHEDGLRVRVSRRELARMAKVSSRTLEKAIRRLEEMGLVFRDTEHRKTEEAGAFVLRATVKQYGDGRCHTRNDVAVRDSTHSGVLHLRAPRLRWSSPAKKGRRGVIKGARRVRMSLATNSRPAIKRLGKIRGAVLDVLDAAGGVSTVGEICEVLHRARPRDLRRRVLPMLKEAGIITVSEAGDQVRLADDWLQRLDDARELGGEIRAESLELARHKRQGEAFRRRIEVVPTPHWTNAGANGAIEHLEPEEAWNRSEKPESEMSPAAETVLSYVKRLGKIRLGLLEQIWLEVHGGDLAALRRAVDESGVQRERLREFRDAEFLFPPKERGEAA